VVDRDSLDLTNDGVRVGIDQVDVVPRRIRLDDPHLGRTSDREDQDTNDSPQHSTNKDGRNHDASLGGKEVSTGEL
jgi:hypothetical protein